jgi:hypothetical protein
MARKELRDEAAASKTQSGFLNFNRTAALDRWRIHLPRPPPLPLLGPLQLTRAWGTPPGAAWTWGWRTSGCARRRAMWRRCVLHWARRGCVLWVTQTCSSAPSLSLRLSAPSLSLRLSSPSLSLRLSSPSPSPSLFAAASLLTVSLAVSFRCCVSPHRLSHCVSPHRLSHCVSPHRLSARGPGSSAWSSW